MRVIVVLFAFLLLFSLGCESKEEVSIPAKEDVIALVVNGTEITERELEDYIAEIKDENLTEEETRELAIERAIREVILFSYFEKQGVTASEEEIEKELFSVIEETEGVETEEEYFDLVVMKGYSERKIRVELAASASMKKLTLLIAENIEVTEEEALSFYKEEEARLEAEGVEEQLLPFEEIKDIVIEDIIVFHTLNRIREIITKERENAKVEIY